MKSSVKRASWFSIPALALITIGSGCGKNAQEEAFDTSASSIQTQSEPVQVEIILKDKRAVQSSVETAPSMPSMTSTNVNAQWGQAGAQQGRYGAAANGGPGYGNGYGARGGQGYGGRSVGLGGPGVGGSLAGDPSAANAVGGVPGIGGPGLGAPGIGGPGVGGPGIGGPGGFGGGFGAGIGGPLGGGFGGPGFAGPGVPFGPGPYGVFEPAIMPYQPFVVEDVVGDWGDDDGCEERDDHKRRKGCKKDGRGRRDRDESLLKTTDTGHVLEQK